jgi:hypothetical protein
MGVVHVALTFLVYKKIAVERQGPESGRPHLNNRIAPCLLAVVLALCATEARARGGCSPLAAPLISLVVKPVAVALDHSKDSGELTVVAARSLVAYGAGWTTNGFAAATMTFVSNTTLLAETTGDGACVSPERIIVTYGYKEPIDLKVTSRFPEGSCQYGVLYDHEMEHVGFYKRALIDDMETVRSKVTDYIVRRSPVRAATVEEGKAALNRIVTEAMQSALDVVVADVGRRNAGIDNPVNYRRMQSLCDKW